MNLFFNIIWLIGILTNWARSSRQCDDGFVTNGKECDECGISYKPNVRIIAGVEAVPNSWPFHVLIQLQYFTTHRFPNTTNATNLSVTFNLCGGTIINKYTVVSAAQCILSSYIETFNGTNYEIPITPNQYYPTLSSIYRVTFGLHNLSSINETTLEVQPPAFSMVPDNIIKHPMFNESNLLNDIMLLTFKDPIPFNQYVAPACLPENSSEIPSNTNASVVGWGVTNLTTFDLPIALQNVQLTVYDPQYCNETGQNDLKFWDKQLCIGDYSGKNSACVGDGGGGAYLSKLILGENRYFVVGIFSAVDQLGCAIPRKLAIYTKISAYVDWIKSNWKTKNSRCKART